MAYTKQTWVDRVVQYAKRFTYTDDGTYLQLTSAPGIITDAGTPIDASHLNHIEDELEMLDAADLSMQGQISNLGNYDLTLDTRLLAIEETGLKNHIINGGMDVWQRSVDITCSASVFYSADCWESYRAGFAA